MTNPLPVMLEVAECQLCGQAHSELELHIYGTDGGRRPPSATHWYMCPVRNEPMTLLIANNRNLIDNQVISSLDEAMQSGKWLVLIAFVDAANKLHYRRQTFNFPKGDLVGSADSVLGKIAVDFENEVGGMLPATELKKGKLPDNLKLFSVLNGAGGKIEDEAEVGGAE